MRALWSDRPNCSHNVSQKVKCIRRSSDHGVIGCPRLGVKDVCAIFSPALPAMATLGEKDFGPGRPRNTAPTNFLFGLLFRS